jgi:hypothetical protein
MKIGLFSGVFGVLLLAVISVGDEKPPVVPTNNQAEVAEQKFADAETGIVAKYRESLDLPRSQYGKALELARLKAVDAAKKDPRKVADVDLVDKEIERLNNGGEIAKAIVPGGNMIAARTTYTNVEKSKRRSAAAAIEVAKKQLIDDLTIAYSTALSVEGGAAVAKTIDARRDVLSKKKGSDLLDEILGVPTAVGAAKTIDLLAGVQLPGDSVSGGWTRDSRSGGVIVPAVKPARLRFRATPPGEYDLVVTFVRSCDDPGTDVTLLGSYSGHDFAVNLGCQNPTKTNIFIGVSDIGNQNYIVNHTGHWAGQPLAGKSVTVTMSVRAHSISAFLEVAGKTSELGHLYTDYSGMSVRPEWSVPGGIGITAMDNAVTISSAKLINVSRPARHQIDVIGSDGLRHIDLLAGVSADDDRIDGEWKQSPAGLQCSLQEGGCSRIALCNAPHCPYTFKIEYVSNVGDDGVAQDLVDSGQSFCWFMGGLKGNPFVFPDLPAAATVWEAPGALVLKNGVSHVSAVSVDDKKVTVFWDGVKIRELTTDGAGLHTWWRWSVGKGLLGLTTYRGITVTSAELIVPVDGPKASDLFPFATPNVGAPVAAKGGP